MCGRFTLFSSDADLVSIFDIDVLEGEHRPSYNQAPSQEVRSVVQREERELKLQKWGLVPGWADSGFRPLINSRSETVTEKPAFRSAVQRRRCLLPTNGYYEWSVQPAGGGKQPYFISGLPEEDNPLQSPVLAMAGIYDLRKQEDGSTIETCSILTRGAAENLAQVHSRMPLFVRPDFWQEWLSPELEDREDIRELIAELPVPNLHARPVNRAVGNFRVDSPEVIFGPPA